MRQPRRGRPKMVWSVRSALRGSARLYELPLGAHNFDLSLTLIQNKQRLVDRLGAALNRGRGLKWWLSATVIVTKEKQAENAAEEVELKFEEKVVRGPTLTLLPQGEAVTRQQVEESILHVVHQSEHLSVEGSNWSITRVKSLHIGTAAYEPLDASGGSWIPTPDRFRNSGKCVVNIKTAEEMDCFAVSVACGLMKPVRNPNRPSHYRGRVNELMNCGDLDMRPMKLCDIPKFQQLNPGFSLSVLGFCEETGSLYPLFAPPERRQTHVCLLLLTEGEKRHFCLVRDMNSFLASQTKHKRRVEFCVYCLRYRSSNTQLREQHEELCREHGAQKTSFALEGEVLKFRQTDYGKMVRPHHVVYCHFDYVSKRVAADDPRRDAGPDTTRTVEHLPVSYCVVAVDHAGTVIETRRHSAPEGKCVMAHFIDYLLELEERLFLSRVHYPIHMSDEQREAVDKATQCWLCGDTVPAADRALDHDHLIPSSNLKGLSCKSKCNPRRSTPRFLPVLSLGAGKMHMHSIFAALPPYTGKEGPVKSVRLVARDMGEYMGAMIYLSNKRSLRLVDCLQFYEVDLARLRANAFRHEVLPVFSQIFDRPPLSYLMKEEPVLPSHGYSSYAELEQVTSLPPPSELVCLGQAGPVLDAQYQRARAIWRSADCRHLGDYMEQQGLSNVIALAEEFERFRARIFKQYEIEPVHFFSASGLVYTSMLKMTRVELDLISDPTQYLFLERSMRGGICFNSRKFSEANVPGTSTYNPDQPHKYILGFDVSNMYASIIQEEKLPCSKFEWVTSTELSRMDWMHWDPDGDIGYTVEVDILYPQALWARDDEYPMAAERISVPPVWWSDAQRDIARLCEIDDRERPPKLISHLGPRRKYVVHGKVLQFMMKRGLVVCQFHRGIRYRQSHYMADFMRDLTAQRRDAQDHCTDSTLKRYICGLFGRMCRQPRKDKDYTLETNMKRFQKKVASPWFVGFQTIGENMIALEMKKKTLRLVEPVYAGVSVLDLSKMAAMRYYDRIKDAFPTSHLLMTDTDSWFIEAHVPSPLDGLARLSDILDTSGLDQYNVLYSAKNRKVPGALKIEYPAMNITGYVGPKSRCYCLRMETPSRAPVLVAKCSGVSRAALAQQCDYYDFKRCLFSGERQRVTCASVRTDSSHGIFTVETKKMALTAFDDKRKLMSDMYTTEAYRPGRTLDEGGESDLDEDDQSLLAALAELLNEADRENLPSSPLPNPDGEHPPSPPLSSPEDSDDSLDDNPYGIKQWRRDAARRGGAGRTGVDEGDFSD